MGSMGASTPVCHSAAQLGEHFGSTARTAAHARCAMNFSWKAIQADSDPIH